MILGEILDTSIVISLFQCFYKWNGRIEQKIIDISCNSGTYRLSKQFWEKIKICFRYSFLGKMTEIKQVSSGVLDGSRALQYLIDFFRRWKDRITCYLRPSFAFSLAKDVREELALSPLRTTSIIITTAILVNLLLSMLLYKQIGLWGWLMRVLFLFAGLAGLLCDAEWRMLKESSLFLKKYERIRNA